MLLIRQSISGTMDRQRDPDLSGEEAGLFPACHNPVNTTKPTLPTWLLTSETARKMSLLSQDITE